MKIPDKYKSQGYFVRVNREKTVRKGKGYHYRAIFAIWDGQKWNTQSSTAGLTTKGLADEWLDAKVKELARKGKDIMLNPETVKGFADAHYKPFLRDHKKIQYEYEFQKLDVICEFLGDKLIDEVNKLDVLAFKTWLLNRPSKSGKGEKQRSDATANRYLSRLRGLLNFAEEVEKRKGHISFKNILAKENPKQAYISFEEFMRVLDKCYEVPKCNRWKRDRSHMRLTLIGGYTTGLRIDELRHVERGMLKTDDARRVGVIKLVMNDSRNKIHTKTVDISTWLYDEMEAAGVFERMDDEKVFDTTNYYNLVKDLFKRAGVRADVTFHTLRAANATERDTAGQDRESIHAGLGWAKDSNVPEKHYLRHQDYHVIEKGAPFNERLQRLRQYHAERTDKEEGSLNTASLD
jgi:integrase